MKRQKQWQLPWLVLIMWAVVRGASSRRYDQCMTQDRRTGLCVLQKYCRTITEDLTPCGESEGTFCCPVPTMKSNSVTYGSVDRTPTYEEDARQEEKKKDEDYEENRNGYSPTAKDQSFDDPSLQSESREQARSSGNRDRNVESKSTENQPSERPVKNPHPSVSMVPECGAKPYDLFIAGGEESKKHEWPWMAAIFKRHQDARRNIFLCGGSLINRRYILSAAHCVVHNHVTLPASTFVVRLGSHYLDDGEDYTVSKVIAHQNHSGSDFFNDIALIRLAGEVYMTDKITPVCLPDESMKTQSFVDRKATVSGWGDTAFRVSGTRYLQHVVVPIVSGEECSAAYSRVQGAAFLARGSDHIICAGLREGGKDACLGDSGGPLMLKDDEDRWMVVGIVSLGYKCAEPGYPGVYTRVTHYLHWIQSNMK